MFGRLIVLTASVAFVWVLTSCRTEKNKTMNEKTSLPDSKRTEVEAIQHLITDTPAWIDLGPSEVEARKRVVQSLVQLREYELRDVREAMLRYIEERRSSQTGYTVADMSRLYLMNRYLLKVPIWVPSTQRHFGGWLGVPIENDMLDGVWPLHFSPEGEVSLRAAAAGYNGDDFLAVEEFDHFLALYGPRWALPKP